MALLEGEIVILNEHAKKGLPNRIGERGVVSIDDLNLSNYQYILEFDDGSIAPVHEIEVNRLAEEDKTVMEYIFTRNKVFHRPSSEEVIIKKVDYLNKKAEVDFTSGGSTVVDFEVLLPQTLEGEPTTQLKTETNKASNEDYLNIFFGHYKNSNDTYTVPKQLLINLLNNMLEEE
jgi:hypothetical protein